MNSLIKPEYETLIFHIRGFKVMIDSDLAILYDVPTKRLKEQVKRNIGRFPEDFMFELTKIEKDELVANCDRLANLKHSSVNPLAFTEQGVSMLSSVLRSEKANKAFKYLLEKLDALHQKANEPRKPIGYKIDKK